MDCTVRKILIFFFVFASFQPALHGLDRPLFLGGEYDRASYLTSALFVNELVGSKKGGYVLVGEARASGYNRDDYIGYPDYFFVARFSGLGSPIWRKRLIDAQGYSGLEELHEVVEDEAGNIYATGTRWPERFSLHDDAHAPLIFDPPGRQDAETLAHTW